jgi:hypothetical protein
MTDTALRGWMVSGVDPENTGVVFACAPTRQRARWYWPGVEGYVETRAVREPKLDAICLGRVEGETPYVFCYACGRVVHDDDAIYPRYSEYGYCSEQCRVEEVT